jgi:hypothetical protein
MSTKAQLNWEQLGPPALEQWLTKTHGFEATVWLEPETQNDWRYAINGVGDGDNCTAVSKEAAMRAVEFAYHG